MEALFRSLNAPVLRCPVWNAIPDGLLVHQAKLFHFAGWVGCRFIRVGSFFYREEEF